MYKIYGKQDCSACTSAKALLDSKGLEYEYLLLGEYFTLPELFELCPIAPRTFPQIFKGDEYIGGNSELRASLGV